MDVAPETMLPTTCGPVIPGKGPAPLLPLVIKLPQILFCLTTRPPRFDIMVTDPLTVLGRQPLATGSPTITSDEAPEMDRLPLMVEPQMLMAPGEEPDTVSPTVEFMRRPDAPEPMVIRPAMDAPLTPHPPGPV